MNRIFAKLASITLLASFAQAGPIPWTYSATLKPAGGADGIVLGKETMWEYNPSTGGEIGTAYFILSNVTKTGYSRTGTETPVITPQTPNNSATLFDFGYGAWTTREQLSADQRLAMHRFVLDYGFADGQGETYRGSVEGSISASGIFTSGTGNFNIGLDHTDTIQLGNRKAKVRFWGSNNESHSVVLMDVTDVVETPEPATIALAGMGLAGVLGYRGRRLRKRKAVV